MNYPIRHIVLLSMALLTAWSVQAQTPQLINYQAVARTATTGAAIANSQVYVQVMIRRGGPTGPIVYQESHPGLYTDAFGLFDMKIGGGQAESGIFSEIQWNAGSFWLDLDIDAGQGLESFGSMQLVAVPYALHAETATHVDDDDADPENELIDEIALDQNSYLLTVSEGPRQHTVDLSVLAQSGGNGSGAIDGFNFNPQNTQLTLLQGDNSFVVDLGSLVEDADADPTNELITGIGFDDAAFVLTINEAGNQHQVDLSALAQLVPPGEGPVTGFNFDAGSATLTLQQGSESFTVDLTPLINDADSDPTNELITDFDFDEDEGDLTIADAGGSFTVNLNSLIDDADADPTNELITDFNFDDGDGNLTIEDAGGTRTVNLNSLIDDADADPTNELITDFIFDQGYGELTLEDAGGTFTVNLNSLIDDADADPTNELNTNLNFDNGTGDLSIADAGGSLTVNLNSLIDDADADPTNELITDFSFNEGDGNLTIEDAGGARTVNLSSLAGGGDTDPTNELNTGFVFSEGSSNLLLSDAGGTFTVNLSSLIDDADADPNNELIDSGSLEVTPGGILQFTEAGISHSVDLAPAMASLNNGWEVNAAENRVYNTTDRIGIGIDEPDASLALQNSGISGQPTLRSKASDGSTVFQIDEQVITSTEKSQFHVNGQYRMRPKYIAPAMVLGGVYNIQEEDGLLIVKVNDPSVAALASITIRLPSAAANVGRIVKVMRLDPFGSSFFLSVTSPFDNINFSGSPINLDEGGSVIVTFLSLGSDGWFTIDEKQL